MNIFYEHMFTKYNVYIIKEYIQTWLYHLHTNNILAIKENNVIIGSNVQNKRKKILYDIDNKNINM